MSDHKVRLGIDLGGTKIEILALADSGEETLRERSLTPKNDYSGTLRELRRLVLMAEESLGRKELPVGIGIPGTLSLTDGTVKNSNSTCLNRKPFLEDIQRELGRPVRIQNDANCFALSEVADGAAQGAQVAFGVILGTGCGGGIVIGGEAILGANKIAGEWGHNPLPWPSLEEREGPGCYCGKSGCIEAYVSGTGLETDYFKRTGDRASAEEISKLKSSVARETFVVYEDRLARALSSVLNILDPEVIVLGGGLSNVARLYESIPQIWGKYIFSHEIRTKLVKAQHGDSSGVRGAARLWPV